MDEKIPEFYIGTAADVSSAGVRILFDGQTEATEKRYKILNTGVQVAADDRVIVAKISGSYVVLGKISYDQSGGGITVDDALSTTSENPVQNKVITNTLNGKVSKSGDTMTGDLVMDAADVVSKSETYTVGTTPSKNYNDRHIYFRDKLNKLFGRLQSVFMSDSRVGLQLVAERTVNNELVQNIFGIYVDENGNRRVDVSDSSLWRTALGLGAAATRGVATSPASGNTSLITSGGVYTAITDLVIGASAAFALPASGSSVSKNMEGLTANHVLIAWNFSASAENMPPADLTCTTYSGYFTVTNSGGTTSETIKPVFALPKAVTLSNH